MKLSIITINYNNVEGLRNTIDSVLCQTWRDFEWIFIDGGSTDGSKELIEKTAAECPNVSYWCSEPDKGVYNAQNKGIAHAQGEYLNFMNSGDTFYDENVLMNVWKEEHHEDVLYGDWLWCDGKKEMLADCPHKLNPATLSLANICHQSMFINCAILKVEGFDESYKVYSDWARWMKMICDGYHFTYIPYIVCRFELGGISGVSSELREQEYERICQIPNPLIQEMIVSHRELKQRFDDYDLDENIHRAYLLTHVHPFLSRILHLEISVLSFLRRLL